MQQPVKTKKCFQLRFVIWLASFILCWGRIAFSGDAATPRMHYRDDGGGTLAVFEGKRHVLSYRYGIQRPPAGVNLDRSRSSYISPVMGLDGERLTEDFAKDHYHHRGVFWAWPNFAVDGVKYDHWHLDGAWTRFDRWLFRESGPARVRLGVQNYWTLKNRKLGEERLELTVWRANDIGQAIDIDVTWTASEPVSIRGADEAGYGGFSVRFPSRKDPVVSFPEGPQERSDMKRSPWGDMSGIFPGRDTVSGLAIFVHPGNPDPQPGWTLRTTAEYGFLGASWPGLETFEFAPKQPVTVRHRIWIHRGNLETGHVKEEFERYVSTMQ